MANKKEINIKVTKDEALVLFDFLVRFNQIKNNPLFEDQAEQRVLYDVECILEKKLTETFRKDYIDVIKEARNKIRDEK
ncbi:MAG: hypothetical protein ACT4ON_03940 [Bacteroidota bacterium]